jgi:hypothetical protein
MKHLFEKLHSSVNSSLESSHTTDGSGSGSGGSGGRGSSKNRVAMVFLSYVELYNNTLHDLLDPSTSTSLVDSSSSTTSGLQIHESALRGVHVTGSPHLRTPAASVEEAMKLIARGDAARATASTRLNDRSSRSHTVLTIELISRDIGDADASGDPCSGSASAEPGVIVGKVNFVDLAGSERVKVSGAEGHALEEAKQINKVQSCQATNYPTRLPSPPHPSSFLLRLLC